MRSGWLKFWPKFCSESWELITSGAETQCEHRIVQDTEKPVPVNLALAMRTGNCEYKK